MHGPEDEGTVILSSIGNYIPKNIASHLRCLESTGCAVGCRVMTYMYKELSVV